MKDPEGNEYREQLETPELNLDQVRHHSFELSIIEVRIVHHEHLRRGNTVHGSAHLLLVQIKGLCRNVYSVEVNLDPLLQEREVKDFVLIQFILTESDLVAVSYYVILLLESAGRSALDAFLVLKCSSLKAHDFLILALRGLLLCLGL